MFEPDYAVMRERPPLPAITSTQWRKHQTEAKRLDEAIEANLAHLGFGD